jgi:predicted PurR-regulated permease PerM
MSSLPGMLPESGPGSRSRRRWFIGIFVGLLLIVLITFRAVLLPFLLAIVFAYVLSPVVSAGERLRFGNTRPPRWMVVVALYAVLISVLVGLIAVSVPRLTAELQRLTREAPRLVATVRSEWLPQLDAVLRAATDPYLAPSERVDLPAGTPDAVTSAAPLTPPAVNAPAPPQVTAIEVIPKPNGGYQVILPPGGLHVVPEGEAGFRVEGPTPKRQGRLDVSQAITQAIAGMMENSERTAVTVLQTAQRFVVALSRGVLTFVLMLMLSAYMLITSAQIFGFVRTFYPMHRRLEFDDLVARIDRGLAGVVRGQLIICGVNAVLSGIGFYLLDLKYWTFLTVIAGVMSIVPIFGSILSTIPAVIVALPDGMHVALLTLAWIVGIHQIEANLLNPKIMGDAARVHPVLVVFALLGGEHVAGIVGALLAVPVLSIAQTLFLYLRERFLGVPRASSFPPPAPTTPATSTSASSVSSSASS